MKTLKSTLPLLLVFVVLSGCSDGDKAPKSDGSPAAPQSTQPKASALNIEEIKNRKYSLKSDLDFAGSARAQYTAYKGTSMETEVVRYAIFYQNQIAYRTDEGLDQNQGACKVFVETSTTTKESDIHFPAGQPLILVQTSEMTSTNGPSSFTLAFQANVFQDLFVYCVNVSDSSALSKQIGGFLEIQ